MKEKFLGSILGLAIGDALGYPAEFLTYEEIKRRFGVKGIQDFESAGRHVPGTYSDDTQMSLAIANALIAVGRNPRLDINNIDDVMGTVTMEFVRWFKSPDNNRAPGNTCMSGCSKLARGISWRQSGELNSKGCGSAMRSAPIGLFYHDDFEKMKMVAIAASLSTHGHPCALAGSLATAYLVSLALHNTNPESMTDMLCHATKPISSEFTAKVMQVVPALNKEPQEAFRVLGEGWVAEESVACALYCFLRSPYDYVQTVLTGANSNGDSDSIACIAGAISGAYNGIGAIPKRWVDHIEKSAILQAAANGLYDLSTKGKKGCFANEN